MYLDDYEKITKDNVTTEYYFLENDVIVTKKTGTSGSSSIKLYQAVTDNLGSILAVYGETNNLVFKAKYDVWGKQTVYKNALGLYRGYTGHEMLPGFELINMGGRMYDPVVARFLSCDNFVQEPTNSQNFNRYSYCLNNPLKYTDPSGNAFVIDDVTIAFMAYGLASSMMTAAATGQNVWRAAGINILSQGATLGIGAAFGSCGGVGYEILRAGAYGFTLGVGCEPVQIPFGTPIPYPALIFQTGWSNASGHIDVSGSWFGIGTGGHADQYFNSGKHPTYVWYSK